MQSNAVVNHCAETKSSAKMKRNNFIKPSLIALAVAQSLSMASADAATIYVGGPQGNGCGLTGAIVSANNDKALASTNCVDGDGDDVIVLNRNVVLQRPWQDTDFGVPLITSNITVNGNGYSISRDENAANFGLLSIQSERGDPALIALDDLTLKNGVDSGAYHSGNGRGVAVDIRDSNLILNNTTISNNTGGPAIYQAGESAAINDSVITDNGTAFYGYFVGITVSGSSISNNRGRGIYTNGFFELNITNSSIDNNGSGVSVHGDFGSYGGEVNISNSSISNNLGRSGLDISFPRTEVNITNSVISNNNSGVSLYIGYVNLFNGDIPIVIDSSDISNNKSGGGISVYSANRYDGNGPGGRANVTLSNNTVTGNTSTRDGGAIYSGGSTSGSIPITVINSTISGNSAGQSGGGIFLADVTGYYFDTGSHELNIINSTIVNNSATDGGGIHAGNNDNLNIFNSIIAGNSATNLGADINHLSALAFPAADLVDSKNNVLGSSTESNFQAFNGFTPSTTDITATIDGSNPTDFDSIVGPLQNNGGSTLTHALVAGSPAIDAGDLDTCINEPVNGLDQRGETRGADGVCDIGAYETQGDLNDLSSISVDSVEVSEGENKARLTISLSSPQTTRIPVDYQTVDGTANDGLDYTGRFGTMTFAPGQTQKIRVIQLNDDDLAEGTETFSLLLSNPVGATLAEAVGEVTVVDDDGFPTISIESDDHSVREGDSGNSRRIRYTITLSSALTERVTLDYQTMDESAIGGVDYEVRSGSMTFMPGQTSKIRSIKVIGDTEVESDETFKLILSNPSSNAEIDVDEADSIGTILNDD